MFNKSIHIKKKNLFNNKKSVHPNSNDPNYPNFFISFTMQKYFEIASIRVQLPKYYHVAYNIISVTVCVSVNNNKR